LVILNAIRGERVYLDTNIFIYALEGYPDFVEELAELFESLDEGNLSAGTSELTLAEVLVRPFIDGDTHRPPDLIIVLDFGGSLTKVIYMDKSGLPKPLCMEPEVIGVPKTSIENYERKKLGNSDLADSA
jgi:hypothetical protein